MVRQLIPEVYQEALEKEKLAPLDLPEIEDVHVKDSRVSFTAKLDIHPEVKIGSYKGIRIKRKKAQVTDEELNKTLEFIAKGHDQKENVVPDDAFARGLGYPTLDDFKVSLRRQLEVDKERHNRAETENEIIDALLKNAELPVPPSAVKKQTEHRLQDYEHRLAQQGVSKDDIKKRLDDARPEVEKASARDVKVFFIMEKIAELENLQLEKNKNLFHKVMEFLLKEANWEE